MIQVWKGQYGITTGGELGVYNKTTNRETEFYDCASDEDMLEHGLHPSLRKDVGEAFHQENAKALVADGLCRIDGHAAVGTDDVLQN